MNKLLCVSSFLEIIQPCFSASDKHQAIPGIIPTLKENISYFKFNLE